MKIDLRRLGLVCAMALALVACGESGKSRNDGKSQAAGEILPHSISDDMIHYDTLRSQPPLAHPSGDDAEDTSDGSGDDPGENSVHGAGGASSGPDGE